MKVVGDFHTFVFFILNCDKSKKLNFSWLSTEEARQKAKEDLS